MTTAGKLFRHGALLLAACACTFGLPLLVTGKLQQLLSGDFDAVTGASVVLDQPSGSYVVLMNRSLHPDEESLEKWRSFFEGGDFTYIFEDLSCQVASGDSSALEMARSLQSQLPENQMKLRTVDATLLLSRMDYGKYDVAVFSREYAEAVGVTTENDETYTIWIDGNAE